MEKKIKIAKKFQREFNNDILDSVTKAQKYDDIINLSIGDPDLDTDKEIMKLGFQDCLNGETHYTDPLGYLDLREAIVQEYKEDYGIDINVKNVMVVSSATTGLFMALCTTLDPDDEVIVLEPFFTPYKKQVEFTGAKIVTLSLTSDNDFQINKSQLESLITDKTKGIIVNYPTNPTGGVFSNDSLQNICDIAIKYNLIVYADDIYTIFNYSEPFRPICNFPGMFERTITVRSFSKDYCMTGFRVGWLVCPEYLIDTINIFNESVIYTVPNFSQRVGLYALKNRKEIQKRIREEFKIRLDYAYERIKNIPFLSVEKPKGSIYMFLDIRKTGMTSNQFADYCLEKYHIIVLPGNGFGSSGEGFVRIALTCNVNKLKEAFDRFEFTK